MCEASIENEMKFIQTNRNYFVSICTAMQYTNKLNLIQTEVQFICIVAVAKSPRFRAGDGNWNK